MPALAQPQYGIQNLYLFPYYSTRDAYKKATGNEAPPWNATRQPKYWEDPKATETTRRTVSYDRALVYDDKGFPIQDSDGKPVLDILLLNKDEAATVNIPPNVANVPGAAVPMVPPPLRALEPNEELFFPFVGVVEVKNKDLWPKANDRSGFTADDRALLAAIAHKLGV